MFFLGTGLASFGYANNYAILYKLGIRNLKFQGFNQAVTDRFQINFGATLGAGAIGGLFLSGHSKSVKDEFSETEQKMNKHIQSGLWIPLGFNGAGMAFSALSLGGSGVSLGAVRAASSGVPRLPGVLLGLPYGVNLLKRRSRIPAIPDALPFLDNTAKYDVLENIRNSKLVNPEDNKLPEFGPVSLKRKYLLKAGSPKPKPFNQGEEIF
jgi:hypothetical protein